jgi:hypothetical protein
MSDGELIICLLQDGSCNKFTLDYGAGFKFYLTEWVALTTDVRHVLPLNVRYKDLLYTFGIKFAFGEIKRVQMTEAVQDRPAEKAAA